MVKAKKRILITGADGFIGSHLTEKLIDEGYDVKAFCYYNSFNSWGWLDNLTKDKLEQIEVRGDGWTGGSYLVPIKDTL
jgi:nucleoside-diphosphate-sugar epimerase